MENSDNRRTQFLMLIILFNIYAVPVYPETGLQAHLRKANLREKQHDFPGAIKHFKNALEIDPQCVEAHIQLGGIYLKMGKIGEAIESYSYAFKLQPSASDTHDNLSAITHYNLGLILARRGDFEKARDLARVPQRHIGKVASHNQDWSNRDWNNQETARADDVLAWNNGESERAIQLQERISHFNERDIFLSVTDDLRFHDEEFNEVMEIRQRREMEFIPDNDPTPAFEMGVDNR